MNERRVGARTRPRAVTTPRYLLGPPDPRLRSRWTRAPARSDITAARAHHRPSVSLVSFGIIHPRPAASHPASPIVAPTARSFLLSLSPPLSRARSGARAQTLRLRHSSRSKDRRCVSSRHSRVCVSPHANNARRNTPPCRGITDVGEHGAPCTTGRRPNLAVRRAITCGTTRDGTQNHRNAHGSTEWSTRARSRRH